MLAVINLAAFQKFLGFLNCFFNLQIFTVLRMFLNCFLVSLIDFGVILVGRKFFALTLLVVKRAFFSVQNVQRNILFKLLKKVLCSIFASLIRKCLTQLSKRDFSCHVNNIFLDFEAKSSGRVVKAAIYLSSGTSPKKVSENRHNYKFFDFKPKIFQAVIEICLYASRGVFCETFFEIIKKIEFSNQLTFGI